MKQYYWIFLVFIFLSPTLYAQRFFEVEIDQVDLIQLNPGPAAIVCTGSGHILGGSPTASGGYGQLLYYWFPADKLDDPTSSNPLAKVDEPTLFTVTVVDERGCSRQDYIKIGTDLCTGIQDLSTSEEFKVFPNPVYDKLFIQIPVVATSSEVELKLFNCYGQLIREEITEQSYSVDPFEWDVQNLPPGLYIVFLSQGGISKVEKIQIN